MNSDTIIVYVTKLFVHQYFFSDTETYVKRATSEPQEKKKSEFHNHSSARFLSFGVFSGLRKKKEQV